MTGNALAQANVVILQGGPSPEAEVSRSSAAGLEQALTGLAGQLTRLEVDRDLTANLLALAPDVVFPALHGPRGRTERFKACSTFWASPMSAAAWLQA